MAGPVRLAGTCGAEHGSSRYGSGGCGGPVAWEEELSAQVAETLRAVGTSEELLLEEHPRTMDWIRGELLRRGVTLEELDRGEAQVAFRGDLDEATDEIDFDIEISRRRQKAPATAEATSDKVPTPMATAGSKSTLQKGFLSRAAQGAPQSQCSKSTLQKGFLSRAAQGAGGGGGGVSVKGPRTGADRAPLAETKDGGSLGVAVAAPAAGGCVEAWKEDLAAEVAKRLDGVPVSPLELRQVQQQIASEAEALCRSSGLDLLLSRGELKLHLTGDREALLTGEATLTISPSRLEAPLPLLSANMDGVPCPEELAKMYEANPAWRTAARGCNLHDAAPMGERGVPLPASVLPVTTPDYAVPAGRRLVNIDFISCTSWPHGYMSKQLLYAAIHAREAAGSPLVFKVWRRPLPLRADEAELESVPTGKRLWFEWSKSRQDGEQLLNLVGAQYDVKFCWTGMTSPAIDSLRMVLFAQKHGRNEEFMAALGWRHFGHGHRLADHGVLLDAAEEAGLDRGKALAVLKRGGYEQELLKSMAEYQAKTTEDIGLGPLMGGIPMFLFNTTNPRYSGRAERLQGSNPQQAFEEILELLESYEH